jgi:hypothetical protein
LLPDRWDLSDRPLLRFDAAFRASDGVRFHENRKFETRSNGRHARCLRFAVARAGSRTTSLETGGSIQSPSGARAAGGSHAEREVAGQPFSRKRVMRLTLGERAS